MNDSDRVRSAVGELYSADPDVFTERRRELAARARAARDRAAAKTIAALGKPTRSAWVVNKLVRADPSVPARLAELGDRLRAGEAALDGASIRELSRARRDLLDGLVRQALAESGQQSASAVLRDEVTDTFSAALADPDIAGQVAAGTLIRAVHWAGFGPAIGTAAPSGPAPPRPKKAGSKTGAPAPDEARGPAERENQRQQAIAAAEEAVAQASHAADAATAAEQERAESVQAIEQQLTDERRLLSHARIETRQADSALRRARQALDRLRRQSS
ncbi:MAG TPA: hypothetical protein VMU94_28750 [Streptosporangiaceae bacterium]|nr:hypothetical protein [Streptosporangiaceae bacterium]